MFEIGVPSICKVVVLTPVGSDTFQVILPFVCETTIWLIVGPTAAALLIGAFKAARDDVDSLASEPANSAAAAALPGWSIPTLNSRRSSSGSKTIRRPPAADVFLQDPAPGSVACAAAIQYLYFFVTAS